MDLNGLKSVIGSFPPWMILGAGFVAGYVKSFWNFVYDHTILVVEKKIKVSVTIEENAHKEAYTWVNLWMEKHLEKRKISSLRLDKKSSRDEDRNKFIVIPGYGFYFLWWKKKLITFESSKTQAGDTNVDGGNGKVLRTITLSIWGTRDRRKLIEALTEAKEEYDAANPNRIRYFIHTSDWWDSFMLSERPMDTIYLPDTQLKDIKNSFEKFFASKDKYRKLGIPWRTGFLFEGPPGTGKSSLVQALSCEFRVPIYYLNLNASISASTLMQLMADIKGAAIILVEDINGVNAAKDRTTEDTKDSGLAIKSSELFNCLDGLVATEERILIMTTNHPDKLDPALVRAGRIDRRFHLGYATDTELQKFYDRAKQFYDLPEFSVFRKLLPEKSTVADAQAEVFKPLSIDI